MKAHITDHERGQSNFESYARSFDEIYGSPEKKSVIGNSLDKLLRKSMFLRFRETLKYINHPDIHSVLDVELKFYKCKKGDSKTIVTFIPMREHNIKVNGILFDRLTKKQYDTIQDLIKKTNPVLTKSV